MDEVNCEKIKLTIRSTEVAYKTSIRTRIVNICTYLVKTVAYFLRLKEIINFFIYSFIEILI